MYHKVLKNSSKWIKWYLKVSEWYLNSNIYIYIQIDNKKSEIKWKSKLY